MNIFFPKCTFIGIYFVIMFLITTSVKADTIDSLRWEGMILDSNFTGQPSLLIEVLETGDSLRVRPSVAFVLILPTDTLWNVCVKGDSLEKCYEIRYTGKDSIFQAVLTGEDFVLEETFKATDTSIINPLPAIDSSLFVEESQETYREDRGHQLKKVVLRVRRVPKRALGKSTVSAKMIKRMPGLAEADVIRSIQGLPGVVASSDFSTKIYVRGGGADQNLFLLDNAVVFSPVHFFGLFSTFLVEGVDRVEFYKGGFDPNYGNRLSSVVDIKSRRGGDEKEEEWFSKSSVKVSTFTTQVHTEGHKGPFRWIHAGRVTYIKEVLDQLRKAGVTDLDLDYRFYDAQGHVYYTINPDHELNFTYYAGKDILDFSPFIVDWGNQAYALNYKHRLSKKWDGHATLSYSKFEQSFGLANIFAFLNDITVLNYQHQADYTGIKNHRITIGTQIKKFGVEFINDQQIVREKFSDPTDFWLYSGYVQDNMDWNSFTFKLGSRFNYSSTVKSFDYEPRFSLKYSFENQSSIDAHIGYYRQYINSILFSDQETINEFYYPAKDLTIHNVEPTSSLLFSLGYGRTKVWDKWDYSIEGYYKTLNHLLVFAPSEVPDSAQNNPALTLGDFMKEGEGYSFGLELSTRLDIGPLFGGASYSLGQSVMLDENDVNAYFPNWHQPHSGKFDMGINWKGEDGFWPHKKKNRYFRSSTQIKLASGLPYTEVIGYLPPHLIDQSAGDGAGGPNPEHEGVFSTPLGNRNGEFVPSYFRWDIKPIDIGREGRWTFAWTILNVTNHENIFLYFYDTFQNPPERLEIPQFPFFPMLINFEFYF